MDGIRVGRMVQCKLEKTMVLKVSYVMACTSFSLIRTGISFIGR